MNEKSNANIVYRFRKNKCLALICIFVNYYLCNFFSPSYLMIKQVAFFLLWLQKAIEVKKTNRKLQTSSLKCTHFLDLHSTLHPLDVQRMSFWDIAITIRHPEWLVIQWISRGCTNVYMCEIILRTKWKYMEFKIPYGSEKYLLFHYYIMKMNYFK